MSSRKRLDALKLSAIAIAAAAAIAPMAYSGGRAAIVNKVTAPSAKTSQLAQNETSDRFIVTYASTASAKANAAAFQGKLAAASKAAGTTCSVQSNQNHGCAAVARPSASTRAPRPLPSTSRRRTAASTRARAAPGCRARARAVTLRTPAPAITVSTAAISRPCA